jgi:hypothetical protein
VANGGTGLATTPANGALLIGNGTNYTSATLTAGTNIAITNGSGSISIATSATPSFATSITTPIVIGGTSASSSLTLQSTSGVGTSDSILFKVGNNGATTAMTVDTSGNVGIGTSSPGQKLEVAGNNYQMRLGQGGATGSYDIGRNPTDGIFKFYGNQTGAVAYTFGGVDGEFVRIAATGNVGIGTSSPSYKLSVSGTTVGSTVWANVNNTDTTSGSAAGYFASNGAVNAVMYSSSNGGGGTYGMTTNHPMTLITNNTERMRIDSSGNVGIGTSSPAWKLDVRGAGAVAQVKATSGSATLIIDGFDGTSYPGINLSQGGVNYWSVQQRADTNLYLYRQSGSGDVLIPSGNVGIGTSSPGNKLVVSGGSIQQYRATGDNSLVVQTGDTSNNYTRYYNTSGVTDFGQGNGVGFISVNGSQPLTISTNSAERMRIDSSGSVLVSTIVSSGTSKFQAVSTKATAGDYWSATFRGADALCLYRLTDASGTIGYFETSAGGTYGSSGGTVAGSITCTTGSTAYNTSSDYRMKENIAEMSGGLGVVMSLRPVVYDWIFDKSKGEGFIAHELAEIIPLAVHGKKDATDIDGKPIYQGVDHSKIVVHLVAAIQELSAKNDALEARLAKLETVQ